jgi:hypothetical protein
MTQLQQNSPFGRLAQLFLRLVHYPWPESRGMKTALRLLLSVGVAVFAVAGVLSMRKVSNMENPFITVNPMICGLSLITLWATVKTKRNRLFNTVFIAITMMCMLTLLIGLTNPTALVSGHAWSLVNLIVITAAAALFIVAVIRFCYTRPGGNKINYKNVGMKRFVFVWLITLNLCTYMATASEAQATGAPSQGVYQLNTSGTSTNGSPQITQECWAFFLFLLLVVGIILASVYALCRAAHICGNNNSSPPSSLSPDKGNSQIKIGAVHNSALAISTNVNILSGSRMMSLTPGSFDLSSSVGVWINTSGFHDPYIDSSYPCAYTVNYSLLQASTNASTTGTGWNTVCTVVQWGTADPVHPLICQILYTNSVTTTDGGTTFVTNGCPMGTNWIQFSFDGNKNMTNATAYGGQLYMPPIDTNAPKMFRTCYDPSHVSTVGP